MIQYSHICDKIDFHVENKSPSARSKLWHCHEPSTDPSHHSPATCQAPLLRLANPRTPPPEAPLKQLQSSAAFYSQSHSINHQTSFIMSAAFQKAAEDSKKLVAKPSNDELLELYGSLHTQPLPELYSASCQHLRIRQQHWICATQRADIWTYLGLYKVGNAEDISAAPAPGMFDMKARPPSPLRDSSPLSTTASIIANYTGGDAIAIPIP